MPKCKTDQNRWTRSTGCSGNSPRNDGAEALLPKAPTQPLVNMEVLKPRRQTPRWYDGPATPTDARLVYPKNGSARRPVEFWDLPLEMEDWWRKSKSASRRSRNEAYRKPLESGWSFALARSFSIRHGVEIDYSSVQVQPIIQLTASYIESKIDTDNDRFWCQQQPPFHMHRHFHHHPTLITSCWV